jgi:dTDP-4-dehydrorhamnose reductase
MDAPKILLFGKIGQVGWELRRTLAPLGPLVCVDYPEIDFAKPDSIRSQVQSLKPHLIINAVAFTAVEKAETESSLAMQINGEAPGILAEEAKKIGAWLVHYSTDYVFDGKKNSPYVEHDVPNPLGIYGQTKLAGDRSVEQVDGLHLILRLCWVYGARGSNFMLTILRAAREREQLRVVSDQIGCPTWSRMIAETTTLALKQVWDDPHPARFKGTYNLCSSGSTSWHGFASSIVDLMPAVERKCQEVTPIVSAEWPTPVRRPAYSVLSCEKLQQTFGLQLPLWNESLKQVLE